MECDFIPSDAPAERLTAYEMIVTPALYCAPQETVDRLHEFVSNDGHFVSTIRAVLREAVDHSGVAGAGERLAGALTVCQGIALKAGSKVTVGDELEIGLWNLAVIAG